jgi:hypothetical protein
MVPNVILIQEIATSAHLLGQEVVIGEDAASHAGCSIFSVLIKKKTFLFKQE